MEEDEEMYEPKIYLEKKGDEYVLIVDDYDMGFLEIGVSKMEDQSFIFDYVSDVCFTAPLGIYEELSKGEKLTEDELWKLWKEINKREEVFMNKLRELSWKAFKERMEGVLEVFQEVLEGKKVSLDLNEDYLKEFLEKKNEKLTSGLKWEEGIDSWLKACPNGFWIMVKDCEGKEAAFSLRPAEAFELLYESGAMTKERAEETMFGAFEDS